MKRLFLLLLLPDNIESLTGYDFFSNVPASIQSVR